MHFDWQERDPSRCFQNEDISKGVLIGGTHVESRSVHALNETTFLVTYSLGILAEEIGSAIEKINEWLSKPVLITCDEATAVQLLQVTECAHHTTGVESVVFNSGLDNIRTPSNPSVNNGYQDYPTGPAVSGVAGTTFLDKIPGIPCFFWYRLRERHCQVSAVASFCLRCHKELQWTIGKSCHQ